MLDDKAWIGNLCRAVSWCSVLLWFVACLAINFAFVASVDRSTDWCICLVSSLLTKLLLRGATVAFVRMLTVRCIIKGSPSFLLDTVSEFSLDSFNNEAACPWVTSGSSDTE